MQRFAVPIVVFLLAAPAMAQVSDSPAQAPGGVYRLEGAHSQLLFSVLHGGLTDYYGRFDKLSGTLTFDSHQPEKSTVSIQVDTASVDTPSAGLNNELQGPDVFDAAKFGDAVFKSTSIARSSPTAGTITGDLTLHGVTKPVTLDATFTGGEANPLGSGYSVGFKATATIKRTDFGITGMRWEPFVGDDVKLIIVAMFDHER
jgi:polyisoprenoid-binding protein YceI